MEGFGDEALSKEKERESGATVNSRNAIRMELLQQKLKLLNMDGEFVGLTVANKSISRPEIVRKLIDVDEPTVDLNMEVKPETFIEEENQDAYSDGEFDQEMLDLSAPSHNAQNSHDKIPSSAVDPYALQQELERVTPLLKIKIRHDAKDWRHCLEQVKSSDQMAIDMKTDLLDPLSQLASDIGQTISKISSREKYINNQLEPILNEIYKTRNCLAEVKEERESGATVNSRNAIRMELLQQKLKLLNMDGEFVGLTVANKSISRHYFAFSTNSAEQFFQMTSLAAWLLRKCGNSNFPLPKEDDNPNNVISGILTEMKKLVTSLFHRSALIMNYMCSKGMAVDYTASRLRIGSGEQCIQLLDCLADEALSRTQFKPEIVRKLIDVDEPTVDLNMEVKPETFIEEENQDAYSDGEFDQEMLDLSAPSHNAQNSHDKIPSSAVDPYALQQELERVTPLLKIKIRHDAKDWRHCLEQVKSSDQMAIDMKTDLLDPLSQLASDIGQTISKISSREKYINNQLEPILNEIYKTRNCLAEVKANYRNAATSLAEKSNNLNKINEELEEVKEQLEERMACLADGGKIKGG
ncbi:hypothetical protein M514_21775 [Trichuris suis]|uniref:Uncharacterized protein n=1 Tax=Trichuris suis TaxID=68888 RepID=A0A085N9F3_9BILA|nr:hypothetical protein M514_21775 [Trichuris suis]